MCESSMTVTSSVGSCLMKSDSSLIRLGDKKVLMALEELGFLADEPIVKMGSPINTVTDHRLNTHCIFNIFFS